jgi:hypothetical protein
MNKQAVFVRTLVEYRRVLNALKSTGNKPFEIGASERSYCFITIEDRFIQVPFREIIPNYKTISFDEFIWENEPC